MYVPLYSHFLSATFFNYKTKDKGERAYRKIANRNPVSFKPLFTPALTHLLSNERDYQLNF